MNDPISIHALFQLDKPFIKKIENPFSSFWMGGFECTDQLNVHGERVDFLHITSHLQLIEEDYQQLLGQNMHVVREGLRWSQIETSPYIYNFETIREMIQVGKDAGIQQIWDLCHFGFPDDLTPLHPQFTKRFESYCRAFALFYKSVNPNAVLIVTPINEVGFISWLGGDVAATSPYCFNNGWQVKYGYVKAYIAGIKALKQVDSEVRILTTEPMVNVTCNPLATGQEREKIASENQLQFQVLDMLCGRICPELGGKEEYLDILGFNYYYNNQWIHTPYEVLGWNEPQPHENYRQPSEMLYDIFKRYNKPMMLSETSHPGVDRPLWVRYIGNEVVKILKLDIPFWGVCWYPIIDRPDWDNLNDWHHAGIWDCVGNLLEEKRVLHQPTVDILQLIQQEITSVLSTCENQNTYEISYVDPLSVLT